jgi:tellurite resistance protein TerC
MFAYLKLGVSFILAYVGVKMLLTDLYPVPVVFSLGVIIGVLAVSIAASLMFGPKTSHHNP